MKTLIIIPAYNEEANVGVVIGALKKELPYADILVVNDGSKDQTSNQARKQGVMVIDLSYNLGIGGAMQTGYLYAARHRYAIAVQVDADGQHPARQVQKLIEEVAGGRTDMASGSRFLANTGYKSTKSRRIGIVLFAKLLTLILGQDVTDATSGFRAVNARVIRLFSQLYPEDYPEVEALQFIHRHGLRFREIPIDMHPRAAGRSSIRSLDSFYYMIKVILTLLVGMLRSPCAFNSKNEDFFIKR